MGHKNGTYLSLSSDSTGPSNKNRFNRFASRTISRVPFSDMSVSILTYNSSSIFNPFAMVKRWTSFNLVMPLSLSILIEDSLAMFSANVSSNCPVHNSSIMLSFNWNRNGLAFIGFPFTRTIALRVVWPLTEYEFTELQRLQLFHITPFTTHRTIFDCQFW